MGALLQAYWVLRMPYQSACTSPGILLALCMHVQKPGLLSNSHILQLYPYLLRFLGMESYRGKWKPTDPVSRNSFVFRWGPLFEDCRGEHGQQGLMPAASPSPREGVQVWCGVEQQ